MKQYRVFITFEVVGNILIDAEDMGEAEEKVYYMNEENLRDLCSFGKKMPILDSINAIRIYDGE